MDHKRKMITRSSSSGPGLHMSQSSTLQFHDITNTYSKRRKKQHSNKSQNDFKLERTLNSAIAAEDPSPGRQHVTTSYGTDAADSSHRGPFKSWGLTAKQLDTVTAQPGMVLRSASDRNTTSSSTASLQENSLLQKQTLILDDGRPSIHSSMQTAKSCCALLTGTTRLAPDNAASPQPTAAAASFCNSAYWQLAAGAGAVHEASEPAAADPTDGTSHHTKDTVKARRSIHSTCTAAVSATKQQQQYPCHAATSPAIHKAKSVDDPIFSAPGAALMNPALLLLHRPANFAEQLLQEQQLLSCRGSHLQRLQEYPAISCIAPAGHTRAPAAAAAAPPFSYALAAAPLSASTSPAEHHVGSGVGSGLLDVTPSSQATVTAAAVDVNACKAAAAAGQSDGEQDLDVEPLDSRGPEETDVQLFLAACLTSDVVAALAALVHADILPYRNSDGSGSLRLTLAYMLMLAVRSGIVEELSTHALLTLLWMTESFCSQYRASCALVLFDYRFYGKAVEYTDPLVVETLRDDIPLCTSLQLQILNSCSFRLWIEEPELAAACQALSQADDGDCLAVLQAAIQHKVCSLQTLLQEQVTVKQQRHTSGADVICCSSQGIDTSRSSDFVTSDVLPATLIAAADTKPMQQKEVSFFSELTQQMQTQQQQQQQQQQQRQVSKASVQQQARATSGHRLSLTDVMPLPRDQQQQECVLQEQQQPQQCPIQQLEHAIVQQQQQQLQRQSVSLGSRPYMQHNVLRACENTQPTSGTAAAVQRPSHSSNSMVSACVVGTTHRGVLPAAAAAAATAASSVACKAAAALQNSMRSAKQQLLQLASREQNVGKRAQQQLGRENMWVQG